jgi:hypothetical protein
MVGHERGFTVASGDSTEYGCRPKGDSRRRTSPASQNELGIDFLLGLEPVLQFCIANDTAPSRTLVSGGRDTAPTIRNR